MTKRPRDAFDDWLDRSRAAQGLAPNLEDPATVERVAALLARPSDARAGPPTRRGRPAKGAHARGLGLNENQAEGTTVRQRGAAS